MSGRPPRAAGHRARCASSARRISLVGIPSYNNAAHHRPRRAGGGGGARQVLPGAPRGHRELGRGLAGTARRTWWRRPSSARPRRILVSHPLGPVHKIVTPYHGIPGKGSAFRTIFAIAEQLGARACAVVDSDLRSITPEWIELLLGPVVEHGLRLRGAALPAPQVRRHDHQLDRLPADPRALRARGAAADRRRVRLLGPPRLALPRASRSGKRTSRGSGSTSG